ncbi:MAG: DSD1 family PLP-dependent enzyme [Magnetovibrio sp.]|nr:DSD1 family PLP-dependent enzyme [Magnetovibrio sp.]
MTAPAQPGQPLADVDTPALIIDLDAFERNLQTMADLVAASGASLRAHSKTHKSPIIARKQMDLGAVGPCCQKVSEAEVMVDGGIDNVLVSNQVAGGAKLDRLADLRKRAWVGLCVDHVEGVAQASAAAVRAGVTLDALVEIDVGAGRCGVPPGAPAVDLAKAVDAADGLRFGGLQSYHGSAQHIRDFNERLGTADAAVAVTRETVQMLADAGLACDIVGGAGTGTFPAEAAGGVHNELQAGSYVFMDADYARNRGEDGSDFGPFEHALYVHARVMSVPAEDRVVVDAGHKACAIDSGNPVPAGLPGAEVTRISDEHSVIELGPANDRPGWGDTLLLIPGHCDPTVNLHDHYVCVRGLSTPDARVEDIWPVAARGKVF